VLTGWLLFWGTRQAQAAFFDLHPPDLALYHWGAFYLAVFAFWMLPTQLSARVMLEAAECRLEEGASTWHGILIAHLPWVLALGCLASVGVGQYYAFDHIPEHPTDLDQIVFDQLRTLIGVTLVCVLLWLLAWIILPRIINSLAVKSGLLDIWFFRVPAEALFGRRATRRTYRTEAAAFSSAEELRFSPQQRQSAWAAIMLFAIWVATLHLVFLYPLETKHELSLAPMFPIVVGAWLPVLTLLTYAAHRLRLPILAIAVLFFTIVANLTPRLHVMRILEQDAQSGPLQSRQPSLEESLQWWRKANDCPERLRSECNVRPIIVAAEGGGSRAAFFTGSMLALLDDLTEQTGASNASGNTRFSRQLFAISSVSGSSLGAAVFAAMREDYRTKPLPPIQLERPEIALWFKSGRAHGIGGKTSESPSMASPRKDMVQQIVSGDFLTPVLAALSLDVLVPFHAAHIDRGDRTYYLEASWERRFASFGRAGIDGPSFTRDLSSLAPDANTWRPHLIFNGTSVTTGRRIITSTLHPTILSPDDTETPIVESVFRDSYDTYDLMCQPGPTATGTACVCAQGNGTSGLQEPRVKGCDIRLSTAVSNSARFPIISSHGDVVGTDQRAVDRVVDGAYFDYSGIVSAMELRIQITRLDDQLRPFVLFLTNDPGFNPRACEGGTVPDELDVLRLPAAAPQEPNWGLFSILSYPLDALNNARIARSEQTMTNVVLLNRHDNLRLGYDRAPDKLAGLRNGLQNYVNFDIISVGARCNARKKQVLPVPMNWWLPMPVQAYLDQEICALHNRGSMAGVLSQLGPQPPPRPNTRLEDVGQKTAADRDAAELRKRFDEESRRVDGYCGKRDAARAGQQTR